MSGNKCLTHNLHLYVSILILILLHTQIYSRNVCAASDELQKESLMRLTNNTVRILPCKGFVSQNFIASNYVNKSSDIKCNQGESISLITFNPFFGIKGQNKSVSASKLTEEFCSHGYESIMTIYDKTFYSKDDFIAFCTKNITSRIDSKKDMFVELVKKCDGVTSCGIPRSETCPGLIESDQFRDNLVTISYLCIPKKFTIRTISHSDKSNSITCSTGMLLHLRKVSTSFIRRKDNQYACRCEKEGCNKDQQHIEMDELDETLSRSSDESDTPILGVEIELARSVPLALLKMCHAKQSCTISTNGLMNELSSELTWDRNTFKSRVNEFSSRIEYACVNQYRFSEPVESMIRRSNWVDDKFYANCDQHNYEVLNDQDLKIKASFVTPVGTIKLSDFQPATPPTAGLGGHSETKSGSYTSFYMNEFYLTIPFILSGLYNRGMGQYTFNLS